MNFFQDELITIRDIKAEDAASLFQWWIDKGLNKHDPRPLPRSSAELINECQSFCKSFDTEVYCSDERARRYRYFIITDCDDNAIGFVNFFSINKEKKQGEMGVAIGDKSYWRMGIAYKAVNAVADYIFNHMDIERIYIETGENNLAAIGLFTKAGFVRCGEYLEDDGFRFIVMEKRS